MDYKTTLEQFVRAAMAIVYNADRATTLINMMTTKQGTITAIHAVLGAIQKQKPIPPELAPLLAVIIMMMLVDMAKQSFGAKLSQSVLDSTVKTLMDNVHKIYPLNGAKQAQAAPKAPGLIVPTTQPQQRPTGLINQGAPA